MVCKYLLRLCLRDCWCVCSLQLQSCSPRHMLRQVRVESLLCISVYWLSLRPDRCQNLVALNYRVLCVIVHSRCPLCQCFAGQVTLKHASALGGSVLCRVHRHGRGTVPGDAPLYRPQRQATASSTASCACGPTTTGLRQQVRQPSPPSACELPRAGRGASILETRA